MKIRWFCGLICLLMLAVSCLSVLADSVQDESVIGSWKLDRVYENASSEDRYELDPENAASLYAETANVYSLFEDGSARVDVCAEGEIFGQTDLTWKESDGSYVIGNDEVVEQEFSWDPDENVFHRYWKESEPEATYHDLDFVYTRVPVGNWQMKMVYDMSGEEPVILDPESAGSLYSESVDLYKFKADGTASVEMEGLEETGDWMLDEEGLLLTYTTGGEMKFTYDRVHDILFRLWSEDDPEATYHSLAFVYSRTK